MEAVHDTETTSLVEARNKLRIRGGNFADTVEEQDSWV
jgi:hypothetical protein